MIYTLFLVNEYFYSYVFSETKTTMLWERELFTTQKGFPKGTDILYIYSPISLLYYHL